MGSVPRPASEGGRRLVRPLVHEERIFLATVGEAGDDAARRPSRSTDEPCCLFWRFLAGKASRAESRAVVRSLLRLRSSSLAREAR